MPDSPLERFIIEDPAGQPLGILLRDQKHFVFFACEPTLSRLERRVFKTVFQATRAVKQELYASNLDQSGAKGLARHVNRS